ncbi:entericidin A/B family lipoprotein [Kistimonas asteriae]|nr:entericidin A/B family lipoprotein [Kistimonas asteriae]
MTRRIPGLVTTAVMAVLMLVAGGCNTMEGLGKDIQALGNKIEQSAGQ